MVSTKEHNSDTSDGMHKPAAYAFAGELALPRASFQYL